MSPTKPERLTTKPENPTKTLESTAQNNGTGNNKNKKKVLSLQPTLITALPAKEASPYYITLSITRVTTTYTTLVQLGDSFPTTYATKSSSTLPPKSTAQHPGIPTGNIVGIIVGCIAGFGLLVGVFYVYLLRARQFRRVQRRRRSRRGSASTGRSRSTAGPGPPGPPPPGPPPPGSPPGGGPFPPAN